MERFGPTGASEVGECSEEEVLDSYPKIVVPIAEILSPSVVNINMVQWVRDTYRHILHEGRGHGSGLIITPDGFTLTNNHVVQNDPSVDVILNDGMTYAAGGCGDRYLHRPHPP